MKLFPEPDNWGQQTEQDFKLWQLPIPTESYWHVCEDGSTYFFERFKDGVSRYWQFPVDPRVTVQQICDCPGTQLSDRRTIYEIVPR